MKRLILFVCVLLIIGLPVFAQDASAGATASDSEKIISSDAAANGASSSVWKYFAAAIAVGVSCLAGGLAVGRIGSAAMGAMSENPELSGKALPYAGLAEGICLWGFLVALLILLL